MNLPKNSKGFTLIELLISVSIIAIISGGIIPSFSGYIKNQNLKQAQEQIKSDLRSIQNKALTGSLSSSSSSPSHWGIRFVNDSDTYTYFISTSNNICSDPSFVFDQGTGKIPNGVKIANFTGCIFFSFQNGDISKYPTSLPNYIDLKFNVGDTEYKRIYFNSAGLIYTIN